MNFNKALTKGPLKLTAAPHTPSFYTFPLELQVSVSLLCMNAASVNVHIGPNHFILLSTVVLLWARGGKAAMVLKRSEEMMMMIVINLPLCCSPKTQLTGIRFSFCLQL